MDPLIDMSFPDFTVSADAQFVPVPIPDFPKVDHTVFGDCSGQLDAPQTMFDSLYDTTSESSSSSPSISQHSSPGMCSPENEWAYNFESQPFFADISLTSSLSFTAPPLTPTTRFLDRTPKGVLFFLETFFPSRYSLLSIPLPLGSPRAAVKRVYVKKELAEASSDHDWKKDPNQKKRSRKNSCPQPDPKSDSDDESLSKRDRNKLSAAKYRKRRKAYVDTLETQLSNMEKKMASQTESITSLMSENKVLKEQLTFLKSLLSGKIPQVDPGSKVETSTSQKAGALMFVLFSCLVLSGSLLHPQPRVSMIDDPSISDFRGPNRVLMAAEDTEAKVQNLSSCNMPALECVADNSALGLSLFSPEEITGCARAVDAGKTDQVVFVPAFDDVKISLLANESVSPPTAQNTVFIKNEPLSHSFFRQASA